MSERDLLFARFSWSRQDIPTSNSFPLSFALMEVEPQRLSSLIVETERAIFGRYLELCMNPRPIEISRDLQNAVCVLIDLKKSIGNPVVICEELDLTYD